jgi:hypothetical protein
VKVASKTGEKDLFLQSSGHQQEKKAKYPEVDEKLSSYLYESRQFGYAESNEMCQLEVLKSLKDTGSRSSKQAEVGCKNF